MAWNSYDSVADTYERVHATKLSLPAIDLLELAGASSGERILDVGTGTGAAIPHAARAAGEDGVAIGVDASVEMLVAGAHARPGTRLAAATAFDLPFATGIFDVVTANFVITHFRNYKTGLADMIRVSRPGGRIAVTSWSDERDDLQNTWDALVQEVIPRELMEPVWKEAAPWHDRFRDRAKLEEMLLEAELRHVRSEQREYRFTYSIEEYVSGVEAWATGRFVREMLGEPRWTEFRARVRSVFAEKFSDPLNDFRTVNLAVATKS